MYNMQSTSENFIWKNKNEKRTMRKDAVIREKELRNFNGNWIREKGFD